MSNNPAPLDILGGITAEDFLSEYWQKKPLLIRQAIPGFQCPISADELAGLSLESEVESRIIIEQGESRPWELHKGPFEETVFGSLPIENWTLLVQQLDAWSPEISDLLSHFSFIPHWRVDDIMASYAPKGGSVGPHFDLYDVFLLQAEGHRNWKIGQWCDGNSALVNSTSLRVLEHFNEVDSWTLEPGDMLYLPPHLAHWGVAEDDCITLSIGFRALDQLSILNRMVDLLSLGNAHEVLLSDPDLKVQAEPGEISQAALSKATAMMVAAIQNRVALATSFGELATEPKNEKIMDVPEEPVSSAETLSILSGDAEVRFNEGSRFAFIELENQCLLFVDGAHFPLGLEHITWVKALCRKEDWPENDIQAYLDDENVLTVIAELFSQGSLYYEA